MSSFDIDWVSSREAKQEEEEDEPKERKKKNSTKYTPISDISFVWPSLLVIAGKSRSGKTVLTKELVSQNRQAFDRIIVISGSAHLNSEYDGLTDKQNFIDPQSIQKIQRLIALQKKVTQAKKKHRLLIIIDNFIGLANVHNGKLGKLFDMIATQGRHLQVSSIFLTQKLTGVSPVIRQNAMYWLVTRLDRQSVQKTLFDHQSKFTNEYKWYQYYNKITLAERYSAILIDNENPYDKNGGITPIAPVSLSSSE